VVGGENNKKNSAENQRNPGSRTRNPLKVEVEVNIIRGYKGAWANGNSDLLQFLGKKDREDCETGG